jgi:all-trans-retinol 13,14-reductase
VFIGSGVGSLVAASALARLGRSVLVLEAHGAAGGFTHTFDAYQVRWNVGLHFMAWPLAYRLDFADLWDLLTEGGAPWLRLPEDADYFLSPDGVFVKRAPRERHRADLHAAFPAERHLIDRYLADMHRFCEAFLKFMPLQALPRWAERLGLGWWLGRGALRNDRVALLDYLHRLGLSRRLRDCLCFTWSNWGGVPSQTSLVSHSVFTELCLDGLWTQARGSGAVPAAFTQAIHKHGGEVRTGARVSELVFEAGRASGVRVNGETIHARAVVSDIGARETYLQLVPPEYRPAHAGTILRLPSSCSGILLYAGLDEQFLARHRLTGVNYWVETEPGAVCRGGWQDLDALPSWIVLTFAARFQQGTHPPGTVPAVMMATVTAEQFADLGHRVNPSLNGEIARRGEKYEELKQQLAQRILDVAEQTWPGFRAAIRSLTVTTPLTVTTMTGHLGGALYGLAPVVGRFSNRFLRAETGIPGLLLTGADVVLPSVMGAFQSGIVTASAILGRDIRRLLQR